MRKVKRRSGIMYDVQVTQVWEDMTQFWQKSILKPEKLEVEEYTNPIARISVSWVFGFFFFFFFFGFWFLVFCFWSFVFGFLPGPIRTLDDLGTLFMRSYPLGH